MRFSPPLPLCWLLFAFLALPIFAADAVTGIVRDESGRPVANARVAVTQVSTGARLELIAGNDGKFHAAALDAGSYVATIVRADAPALTQRFQIVAGQTVELTLVPGNSSLYAEGPNHLPSNGRTALDVIRETALITFSQQALGLGNAGYNAAVNAFGQRSQSNSFLVDGLDQNEPWTRGPMLIPETEAIAAVSMQDGYLPSEFGRAAGAVVYIQTQSGTNGVHGTAFENFRNSSFDSRNFFDGAQKPATNASRFGAALGGPLRKNVWFLFGNAELLRSREGNTVISTVPTPAERNGDFNASPAIIYDPSTIVSIGPNIFSRQRFANNKIPLARVPLAVQRLVALYPLPNLPGLANNYAFPASTALHQNHFDLRSDLNAGSHEVFVRFSGQTDHLVSPGALPNSVGSDIFQGATNSTSETHTWSAIGSDTFRLSPTLLNQIRVGYAVYDFDMRANDQGPNAAASLGIPGLSSDGLPTVNLTGFTSLGSAGPAPARLRTSNLQFDDTVSWTTAHHSWQFGFAAVKRNADGNASEGTSRGIFSFTPDYTSYPGSPVATGNSFASLLLGFPNEVSRDVQFQDFQLRAWEWSGFAQDQFRWKRLTVQAGLRYSFLPPVTEANDRLVNFNFSLSAPALNQVAGQNSVNRYGGISLNKRALAPRIGFALELSEKTVLRGGFSKMFDTGTYLTMGRLARNAPFASQLDIVNGTFQLGDNISAGLPPAASASLANAAALNASRQAINAIEPQNFTPYADQWDLFLERRIRPGLVAEIGGLGSMGVHLYAAYDANQPYPAPTPYATARYPFEPFHGRLNYLNLGGGSTYYGGQARLTGRIANRLQVSLSYAFAKALDDAAAPGTVSASRPTNPQFIYSARGNRSPSVFDITQRAVLTAAYQTNFSSANKLVRNLAANWNVGTLITLQSGFPLTPELATNSLNNGGYQLPDRIAGGELDQRSSLHWFDTQLGSAFRVPALYQYGNSGLGVIRGPGLATVNLSLARTFRIRERVGIQPRVEVWNLLNRTNFALPDRYLGVDTAGTINHTATAARQLQLSVAILF